MKKPDPLLFELQNMIVKFSLVERNHYLAGTNRHENDTEHSFSVTLLCWLIHDKYKIDLDLNKILKYALAHDLVEVHAGDVNTFATVQDRENKIKNEQAALKKLSKEFEDFPDLVSAMHNYENKKDEEARFVWTVDKMQHLIMGDLDNWRPYEVLSIDYDWFCEKHQELLENASVYIKEIYASLIEYCKTTYYDQPSSKQE